VLAHSLLSAHPLCAVAVNAGSWIGLCFPFAVVWKAIRMAGIRPVYPAIEVLGRALSA
jgi:hypothetical protein